MMMRNGCVNGSNATGHGAATVVGGGRKRSRWRRGMTESTERGGGRNETKEIRTTTPIALETDEGWEEWAERRETSKNAAKGGKAGMASLAIPAALAIGNVAAATRWGRGKKDEEEGREGKEKEEVNRNGKKKRRRRWGKPQPSEEGAPSNSEGGAGQYAAERGGSVPPLSNVGMGGWLGSSRDPSRPSCWRGRADSAAGLCISAAEEGRRGDSGETETDVPKAGTDGERTAQEGAEEKGHAKKKKRNRKVNSKKSTGGGKRNARRKRWRRSTDEKRARRWGR